MSLQTGAVRAFLVAALATTLVAGCSQSIHVAGGGAGPNLSGPIKLAPGTVKADLAVVGDADDILKEAATDSFEAGKMKCTGSGCGVVDLHAYLSKPASSFDGASPPIRIVELVAGYHGAGAPRGSSKVSYQRTVAVSGNLSTATWMRLSDALTTDLVKDFSFRSRKSGIVVRLPSWATRPTTLARTSQPKAFHVATTSDGRADDDTIGNVDKREVRLARRATDYITEMLTDDLRGSGHTIVPAKDGRLVGSELEKFWISSVSKFGGWSTKAEIELDLEVAPPPGVKRKKKERHKCSVVEETSSAPGEPDLARILQKCLGDLARSIRSDSAWSLGQS